MAEKTKFNVDKDKEKRTYDGIVFDSTMEMKFYRDVVLPHVRSGDISYYELQKEYELQPKFEHDGIHVRPIVYVADFYIEDKDGSVVVVDTKGCADSCAKMKRKMFWYTYPDLRYEWVCYSKIDGGWVLYETVQRGRRERRKKKKEQKSLSEK